MFHIELIYKVNPFNKKNTDYFLSKLALLRLINLLVPNLWAHRSAWIPQVLNKIFSFLQISLKMANVYKWQPMSDLFHTVFEITFHAIYKWITLIVLLIFFNSEFKYFLFRNIMKKWTRIEEMIAWAWAGYEKIQLVEWKWSDILWCLNQSKIIKINE